MSVTSPQVYPNSLVPYKDKGHNTLRKSPMNSH